MIQLIDVCKRYRTRSGDQVILDHANFSIRKGQHIGILGANGSGKSTLIRILGGSESPDRGRIVREMRTSWPIAFNSGFHGTLSGNDNIRFICRIYGADIRKTIEFVADFSELGRYLDEPMKTYSSGMSAKLAFAVSMAIEFDCFLIDEVLAVGDERFQKKCREELFEKRGDRAMIIVSHIPETIMAHCDNAYVLAGAKLHQFESISDAFSYYRGVTGIT